MGIDVGIEHGYTDLHLHTIERLEVDWNIWQIK